MNQLTNCQTGHDGSHFRRKELSDVEEGNGAQAEGVSNDVEGDAAQREPVEALKLLAHGAAVLSRVHEDGQDEQRQAHDQRGGTEQESSRVVPDCRDKKDGPDQLDDADDNG